MFSSAYIKGKSHTKCDDYAYHTDKCGFLSDGCSSALNPEIGAKLLPFYAAHHLNRFIWENKEEYNFKKYIFYLEQQLKKFMDTFNPGKFQNKLFEEIFSCTLGGIVQYKDYIHMSLMGDGCMYYELMNGEKHIIIVSFEQNYPFYISYLFRQSEFDSWCTIPGNDINIEHYKMNENCDWVKVERPIPLNTLYLTITQSIDDVNLAVVFSDGPEQIDGFTPIEAIYELTNFKNYTSDFAWRRLLRFEQNLKKDNKFCHDDLSMVVYKRD